MQDQQALTLTTVLSDVLSNLAFMFADDESPDPPSGEVWLESAIQYRGPVNGGLRLRCTRSFASQLAANLLGVDPGSDDADRQGNDAVCEFMNVCCGQYVTAAHGSDAVFNLSIPSVRELMEMPDLATTHGDSEVALVSADGHLLHMAYTPGMPGER